MISTSDFRNGAKILMDNAPYIIVEFQHVKPGKGGAFVRTKLKNLLNGSVLERTFRAGEKLESPDLEEITHEFLYEADGLFYFMNNATYEQIFLQDVTVGKDKAYLKEGTHVTIMFFNGTPVNVSLPFFVELAISKTDPGVKGDTATGGSKPATVESGGTVKVPLYINEGDIIKIDTRTGTFVERIKSAS